MCLWLQICAVVSFRNDHNWEKRDEDEGGALFHIIMNMGLIYIVWMFLFVCGNAQHTRHTFYYEFINKDAWIKEITEIK